MAATRSSLAVLLHADVVGSTALVQRDERTAHERMQAAFRRLSECISRYHGTTHELRGDALVAEFSRASDAVCAALAFQQDNLAANAAYDDAVRPAVRVGIALGEVVIADGTVTGAGVVLAQRLEQLAEPGGVSFSAAVREALPARLPLAFESLGEQSLKGFDEPVRAFRVAVRDGQTLPEPDAVPVRRRPSARRLRIAAAVGVILVALAGWFGYAALRTAGDRPPGLGKPSLSLVVLPFANLSGDADQDYFADALTDDLTSDLSRIAGSFIISRSTAATYRGRELDAKEITRELNVRYLLEGTVRRAGDAVRVNVGLIDGDTGEQVWSERYQRSAADMYAFQDQVTGRIARELNLELKDAISRRAARAGGDPGADDLAQRAWAQLWTKPQTPETNAAALDYVARALDIEADHAEALGVAAYAYARAATYGWGMSHDEAVDKGIAAGERSVALDPKNADAVYALGFLYYRAGENLKAQELFRRCIDLNRNHAPAYFFQAVVLMRLGEPKKAIAWLERAFALSPRDPLRAVWFGALARAQVLTGDDAAVIDSASKGIAANPKHPHNYAALASAHAHRGELDQARAALAEFRRLQPDMTLSRYRTVQTGDDPVAIEAYARLLEGLRRAGLPEA